MRGAAGWPEAGGERVGVQSRAHDGPVRRHVGAVRQPDAVRADAAGTGPEPDLPARRADVGREVAGDGAEVDDRGGGRVQRGDPARVRLDRAQPGCVDEPHPRHAVGRGALVDALEARQLLLVRRDEDLAARLVGDPPLGAVGLEQRHAAPAQPRLQRAGLVVQARVHDAAVAPRLVRGDLALLLEDDDDAPGRSSAMSRPSASPRIPPPTMQ